MSLWGETDQADNQSRPDVTEFVIAVSLVLAETFEKVVHLKKARNLACSRLVSLQYVFGFRSKARTGIVSKNEATHRH